VAKGDITINKNTVRRSAKIAFSQGAARLCEKHNFRTPPDSVFVKSDTLIVALLTLLLFFISGCSSLFPSVKRDSGSQWKSFEEAKTAFDKIVPYETTSQDLETLGFDPFIASNIEILSYLDIIQRFMPNTLMTKEVMDQGIQDCIAAKDWCQAHEFTLKEIKQERYGNIFLDFFRFKRQTRTSGWEFQPFIVMKDGLVVYKMWTGKPNINETVEEKNPLGLLQSAGDFLMNLAKAVIG
jgi:hypothetical protein